MFASNTVVPGYANPHYVYEVSTEISFVELPLRLIYEYQRE